MARGIAYRRHTALRAKTRTAIWVARNWKRESRHDFSDDEYCRLCQWAKAHIGALRYLDDFERNCELIARLDECEQRSEVDASVNRPRPSTTIEIIYRRPVA